MLHSMAIRLIHVDQLEMLYLCYGVKCQSGVIWGHRGQNIVFAQNNVQNASPPTDYVAWSRDSCTWIGITPSQKVMVLKNHKGSIGGHRGQNIVFTQNVLTPPIYSVYSYNLCKFCSLGPSTIVLGSEFNLGSRGVTEAQIMILHNAHNFYPSFF